MRDSRGAPAAARADPSAGFGEVSPKPLRGEGGRRAGTELDSNGTFAHRASPLDPARGDPEPVEGSRIAPRRVALVHDWLTGMRGGEKVLEAIAELFPDATIHTLVHVRGSVSASLERHPERRSFVQWLPSAARHYRQYLPLFPTAIEQFDFDPYDLVISTSHCAAKSVVVPGRARHICYCHSPMRYAWDQFDSYFGPAQVGPALSRLLRPVIARLARWDAATAGRVDRYVANSHYVAGRIRRYYNRRSTVVYPPVDTTFYRPDPVRSPEPFFLVVSALVPYKRLDLAIRACAEAGVALKLVGKGPEEGRLRRLAQELAANVDFAGWLPDEEIRDLYQRCRAVLMPGVEDFGMVPVEAQACGRPVVALARGGAVESVVDGITGVLVQDSSVAAFSAALRDVSTRPFDAAAIRRHAESFGKARFQEQFQSVIDSLPDSESRGSHNDFREVGARRPIDPAGQRNAARYRHRPYNLAARENRFQALIDSVSDSESRGSHHDSREFGARRPIDSAGQRNAARYRHRPYNLAARENQS